VRDPRERLRDVPEAIERIERYAARGRDAFEGDELIQSWFVHHLQIIGEAVRTLPADVRERAPDVPWSKIVGMRHILVHDYFEIDADAVWKAIQRDIPELKRHIEELLGTLDEQS
jgi:uncharacterized protein with HEPN domain